MSCQIHIDAKRVEMPKVLVVEDERYIRELLVDTLIDFGFEVLESVDGGEAYTKASQEIPDLILLDVMLPMLDGFEVLAKLKRNPETEAIPIIMLTALSAEEREQDAYNSGVSHYISKPFDADTLESTIRVALGEAGIEEDSDPPPEELDGPSGESSDESSNQDSAGATGDPSTVAGGGNPFRSLSDLLDLEPEEIPDAGYITIGESLTALEKQLGGGIKQGTVTLMVGASGTGKSVLCQTMAFAALQNGHGVAYFTSNFTPEEMVTQMNSIGLGVTDEDQASLFGLYQLPEPVFGEDSGALLKDLAVELAQIPTKYGFIVVDAITDLASTSQDSAIMAFIFNCKRMCSNGRTVVVVAHSSAFSTDLLGRASSVCETFMKISTGKLRDKAVRKAELLKVDDIELDRDNMIASNVEPELGLHIIPYGQVKA